MGTNRQSPAVLKATCPICGTAIEAGTLNALLKSAAKHCKKSKTASTPVLTPTDTFDPAKAPYVWRFNRNIESQNKTTYGHWSVHAADKKNWMGYVQVALFPWRGTRLAYSHWSLRRIYAHPYRRLDLGNVVGGYKPLCDCIRDLGVIWDDDDKHFVCDYSQAPGDATYTELSLLSWTP